MRHLLSQCSTIRVVHEKLFKMEDVADSPKTEEENKIQTFVFLDLEATGLVGDDTRILELSMIAVSRDDLLSMKDSLSSSTDNNAEEGSEKKENVIPRLPRVLHKYTKFYYPRKLITPKLEEITGLSNELLHRLPGFNTGSAEAVRLFLDLPKPISLVAHNGLRYDFPLLKAEVNNVYAVEKFDDLQCTDTLIAIKNIDALQQKENDRKEISEISEIFASLAPGDMDDDNDDMSLCPSVKRSRMEEAEELPQQANISPYSYNEGTQRILEISAEAPITPVKGCLPSNMGKTPATPYKNKAPPVLPITPEASKMYTPGTPGFNAQYLNGNHSARRSLTYSGNAKRRWDGTKPYTQSNIYKRIFSGAQYDAHRAESDANALLEICGHYGDKFVEWADAFSEKFVNVKPMWFKRKSFRIQ